MLFSSGFILFAIFATGFPFVEALAVVLFTPSQTLAMAPTLAAPPSGLALSGRPRPPLPTTTLSFEAELARKRQASPFSTNCAYFNGNALTCPTSQYCAYNQVIFAVGCCSLDSSGNGFASDCVVPSECLNQAESSVRCPASGCAAGTTVCGVDTSYPDCVTYNVYGATSIYSIFSCGARASASLTLKTSISYQNPLPPATASTPSKISCPSACRCKSTTTK